MSLETSFARLLGRQPSDEERERLYRVREALSLGDNDALWLIVMALESYDALYRQYPERLAEATQASLEQARAVLAAAAQAEAAKTQRVLADVVAEASLKLAKQRAERPWAVHRATAMLGAVVLFGAVCMAAGATLGASSPPFWLAAERGASGWARTGALVLGAPAGWLVFVLALPVAGYGLRAGWTAARAADGARSERLVGGALMILSAVATVACGAMLAKIL